MSFSNSSPNLGFTLNLFMNIESLIACMAFCKKHNLFWDRGTDSKWKILKHICMLRVKSAHLTLKTQKHKFKRKHNASKTAQRLQINTFTDLGKCTLNILKLQISDGYGCGWFYVFIYLFIYCSMGLFPLHYI